MSILAKTLTLLLVASIVLVQIAQCRPSDATAEAAHEDVEHKAQGTNGEQAQPMKGKFTSFSRSNADPLPLVATAVSSAAARSMNKDNDKKAKAAFLPAI